METWSRILSILISAMIQHGNALASMPAPHITPIAEYAASVEKQGNPEDVALVHFARDVLKLEAVNGYSLVDNVIDGIRGLENWGAPLSPKALAQLKADRPLLQKKLEFLPPGTKEASDVWPWVQYQLGEKAAARAALSALYGREVESVLQLKEASYFMGHGPLTRAEYLVRAMKVVSPEKAKDFDADLQKMKVHVSNLPQSAVTT